MLEFVAAVTQPGTPGFVPPAERHRGVRQRRHAVGRAAHVRPGRLRARPREGARPAAPRVEDATALRGCAGGRREGARSVGREGHRRARDGDPRRNHHRRVRADRVRVDRERKHPRFGRPYTELAYQPMLELLAYLRENGFETYIVSGGGIEFMRPWTERVYGIPPEHVVGSSIATEFGLRPTASPSWSCACRRSTSSTTRPASRSGSRSSSAAARSSRSGTPTATSRCSSGRRRGAAGASWASSTTPMPSANGHMIGSRPVGQLDKALDEANARGWTVGRSMTARLEATSVRLRIAGRN